MAYKTLGILGGGQLGRMSAQAARELGIKTIIYTPEQNSPASQVADNTIVGDYSDREKLKAFSAKVEVISYEFENIPVETVRYLQTLKPVYPDEKLLEVSQDRIAEKTFLNSIGIPTARFQKPEKPENVDNILAGWGQKSCIIKTARFGYDGKGQIHYTTGQDINEAWRKLNSTDLIVEEIVDFDCEISVIVGRDEAGKTVTYGPVLNEHRHHILHKSTAPATGISKGIADESLRIAAQLAAGVNLRGVLALELFVTQNGRILANEIAPRTHNSGHWTIDACKVSQFAQHVRTVCGLGAADPAQHSAATMVNLIGDDVQHLQQYENKPGTFIHLYGKTDIKPGRKMGHVTILGQTP